MSLQSTLKGYVCQLKNWKSRNGRTVHDSSETLVPAVPLADEADAPAAEALLMERTSRNYVWGDIL